MILKSLSRKSNSGGQLINYVLRYVLNEDKSFKKNAQHSFIITNNIRSKEIKGILDEFKTNESFRLRNRRDSVRLFHSILSLSNMDKKCITDEMLKDLGKKFIELRAKNCLVVGAPHFDRDHAHLHLVHSGTQLNGHSARISKNDLQKIKLDLDNYQKEKYPELIYSLPEHGHSREATLDAIIKTVKSNRQTKKQMLLESLNKIYEQSVSKEDFISKIQKEGHEVYFRNNQMQGINLEGKIKFRFAKLGFDEEKLMSLNKQKSPEKIKLIALEEIRHRQMSRKQEIKKGNDKVVTDNDVDQTILNDIEKIRMKSLIRDKSDDNVRSRFFESESPVSNEFVVSK